MAFRGVFGDGAISRDQKNDWNASTNVPALASGVGERGEAWRVTVPGSTALDGISSWAAGDWAVFNGSYWEKVDNTDVTTLGASVIVVDGSSFGGITFTSGMTDVQYCLSNLDDLLSPLLSGATVTLHEHVLSVGANDITVSATTINTLLSGISANGTAENLNLLTSAQVTTLHGHNLVDGARDVTVGYAAINTALSGASANITAANLNTLTSGQATALHRHEGISVDLVAGEAIGAGVPVYISGNDEVSIACASAAATALTVGIATAAIASSDTGAITISGRADRCAFGSGLTLAAGDTAYLSIVAGELTDTAPTTAGEVVVELGLVVDASEYVASGVADVVMAPKKPVYL